MTSSTARWIRRAPWSRDASELAAFLSRVLGAPPWEVFLSGVTQPVEVDTADPCGAIARVCSLLDAESSPGLLEPECFEVSRGDAKASFVRSRSEGQRRSAWGAEVVVFGGAPRNLAHLLLGCDAYVVETRSSEHVLVTEAWLRDMSSKLSDVRSLPGATVESDPPWLRLSLVEEAFARTFDAAVRAALGRMLGVHTAVVDAPSSGVPRISEVPQPSTAPDIPTYLRSPAATPKRAGDSDAHDPPGTHAEVSRSGLLGAPPSSKTEAIDLEKLRAMMAQGPVPFSGTASPPGLVALREVPRHVSLPGVDDGDSTMMVPNAALVGRLAMPPFAADMANTPIPDLTVDRYAALCAEVDAKGPTLEVLRRYEIPTEGALRALHGEQSRRFAADPALRARFEERVAHFLRFLRPAR